jgi:zinc transport system substrate-binding protein
MLRRCFQFLVLSLALVACTHDQHGAVPETAQRLEPLAVYTVNYPLQYFAERIGGDEVRVSFPAPVDVDPAHWRPDADTILAFQTADLILLNGAGYANWMQRVTLPTSRLVDTSASFRDRYVGLDNTVTHTHGPEGKHAHGSVAFTTWLDPQLAIEQAGATAAAFAKKRPDKAEAFEANLAVLRSDVLSLDERLVEVTKRIGEQPLLFSHPVYQYFARRYGLHARSLHWEPDEAPSETMWQELQTLLAAHPATRMLWESDPLPETRTRLETLGVKSTVYDPCGNVPDAGDWLDVMQANVGRLEGAVKE